MFIYVRFYYQAAVSACFCFVAIPMLLEVTQLFTIEKNQQCKKPSVSKSATIPRHMHETKTQKIKNE